MGENGGINFRNWRLLPSQLTGLKNHLDLQLMPSMEVKPFFGVENGLQFNHPQQQLPHLQPTIMTTSMIGGPYHHQRVGGISDSSSPINYLMDACFTNHQEKTFSLLSGYQHQQPELLDYGLMPESSLNHPVPLIQQGNLWENDINASTDEVQVCKETDAVGLDSKRGSGGKAPKSTKAKKPKKDPKAPREECSRAVNRARAPKKSAEAIINGISINISGIAVPVCTCTGTPQQCYRWGAGGWQSACCTTSLSLYPLPMSTKRRGARIPGRKMSFGAFRKVLEKLASEGYDFSNPIDLGTHWAKHGTNKFVTIR